VKPIGELKTTLILQALKGRHHSAMGEAHRGIKNNIDIAALKGPHQSALGKTHRELKTTLILQP
jgi:hypothetical protein